MLTTNSHFRPYLSPRIPKMIAPTARNINVVVIPKLAILKSSLPQLISEFGRLSVLAIWVRVTLTLKKSKLSHVHASYVRPVTNQSTNPARNNNQVRVVIPLNLLYRIRWSRHWRFQRRDSRVYILPNCRNRKSRSSRDDINVLRTHLLLTMVAKQLRKGGEMWGISC